MTAVLLGILSAFVGVVGGIVGDLLSAEVRHRLDRVPVQLMHVACRKLPEPVRSDRTSEWAAELDAILAARGATKLPITRLIVGVRFALGLFIATPAIGRTVRRSRPHLLLKSLCSLAAIVGVPFVVLEAGTHLTVLVAELTVFVVLVRIALVAALRRDRPARSAAVALVPFTALFMVDLVRTVVGSLPATVSVVTLVLLMVQPVLTLQFTNLLSSTPRVVTMLAVMGCPAVAVLTIPASRPLTPGVLLLMVAPVTLLQLIIGLVIIRGGFRCRVAGPRMELVICGVATTLFGIALANLYVAALPGAGASFRVASRAEMVVAAIGYLVLVAPPRWMRLPWDRRNSAPVVAHAGT